MARFMAAAVQKAGSQVKLYRQMEREGIAPANPKSISDRTHRGTVPATDLFEIARLTKTSLDEFALGSGLSLVERVKALEGLVLDLAQHTGFDVAERTEATGRHSHPEASK